MANAPNAAFLTMPSRWLGTHVEKHNSENNWVSAIALINSGLSQDKAIDSFGLCKDDCPTNG